MQQALQGEKEEECKEERERIVWSEGVEPAILTFNEKPVVNNCLNVGIEEAGDVMTHL